jgi:hypothetical protein
MMTVDRNDVHGIVSTCENMCNSESDH